VKVVLFGATGMIGQGVLREALLDPEVTHVLCIGRTSTGKQHEKMSEIVTATPGDLASVASDLAGYDACLFCLGVSAAGMSEAAYRKVTYDLTLGAARTLLAQNPNLTFLYITGASTDSTEKGRVMWARVKGATENALLALPFKGAYMFRPGIIQPMHGIVSKTKLYRFFYTVFGVLIPLIKVFFPDSVMTTESLAKAMLEVAKHGAKKPILEIADINAVVAT